MSPAPLLTTESSAQALRDELARLRVENVELAWSSRLLEFQQQSLERIAEDMPRDELLVWILDRVERLVPGMQASVLFLCGQKLYHGFAPSLPEGYTALFDTGVPIGPCVGSCGTAAFRKEPVYVADIATDPLWGDVRDWALPHGLRACWSLPILAATGEVFGTFAMYYCEAKVPSVHERRLIEAAVNVVRLAIERQRAADSLAEERARLRESEERFREFMDHCPAASFIKDDHGRFVYANPVWRAQYDPPPAEWVGKTDADFWPQETADLFRASDRECLATGKPLQSEERAQTALGETKTWLVMKFPLQSDGRWLVGGMAWDVSERQRAEDAARDAQDRLLLRERHEREIVAEELERMRAEVVRSARLTALGQLAASVAHDLRNPLGVVRNASYYLRRRTNAEPKWAEYLALIDREVVICDGIISNLLELAWAKQPVTSLVDLGDVVTGAFRRLATSDRDALKLSLAPDPLVFRADPVQLRQVFDNLFKNAREATTSPVEIDVAATADAAGVRVRVRDSGPGVPDEIRPQLFQPLYTTKAKGTGLGLWICQQVLERHGGTIRLGDATGPGAVFEIFLPSRADREEPV